MCQSLCETGLNAFGEKRADDHMTTGKESAFDPTVHVRGPFTPALGVSIAPKAYPHFEGTGGVYLREGGEHNRVLLLTARHAVLPPSEYRNEPYTRKTNRSRRREVILLGSKAYSNAVKSIMSKIRGDSIMVGYYKHRLEALGEDVEEDVEVANAREKLKGELAEAEESMRTLNEFHNKITRFWSTDVQRILGHVLHAPPISVGTGDKCYTEDWALVELHSEKIDWKGFKGNIISLGTFRDISPRSAGLTSISRNQYSAPQFRDEDAPSR